MAARSPHQSTTPGTWKSGTWTCQGAHVSRLAEYQEQIAEIKSDVRLLKVARAFEVDLQQLKVHLRMVREHVESNGGVFLKNWLSAWH